jgi:transglutaminase-like putative cysteine protease
MMARGIRLRSLAIDGLIAAAWISSAGLVALHERGSLWGTVRPLATISAGLEAKEQWFGLYYQGRKIGFSHLALIPDTRDGVPGTGLIDRGQLDFNLLGTPQRLEVSARAFIDAEWRLQAFLASIRSEATHMTWRGERQGEALLVTVETPTSTVTKRLRDPSGSAFVNGLSSWVAFHRLRVGQSGRAWVLNPLSLAPELVFFHVRRREPLDGRETLVVESEIGGLSATSWVTPEGEVLKEVSPLGWELRRTTDLEAVRPTDRTSPALDLLSTTAVPIDRSIEAPLRVESLVLLLEGTSADQIAVQRAWQRALPVEQLSRYSRVRPEGRWCLLELRRPAAPSAAPPVPEGIRAYQDPSPFVQSDDPAIVSTARRIIGTRTDPWEQAVALNRWVFATVSKRLTIGLPSALDVLAAPSGDCHEHTVLFTALARSAGLPTRMVAGLVSQGGRLYYHAWPEVWIGEWVPTDPTLGQPLADATHLGLSETESERLVSLGQFIGRLRVSVLELREAAP